MAKETFATSLYFMASQTPQRQDSRYGIMGPPGQQTHSSIPPPSPNYQPSSFTLPTQVTHVTPLAQAPAASQTSVDPLEQRVLDLLYPYRDECFADENGTSVTQERMALILCGMFPDHALCLDTLMHCCIGART
jgi:hypothetical protein